MDFYKQAFVSFLAIIIVTFLIYCYFIEHPIREGIPPFYTPVEGVASSMMLSIPKGIMDFLLRSSVNLGQHIAATAQSAAQFVGTQAMAMANFTAMSLQQKISFIATQVSAAAKHAASSASRIALSMKQTIQAKLIAIRQAVTTQLNRIKDAVKSRLSNIRNSMTFFSTFSFIFKFIAFIIAVFAFLGRVFYWLFLNIKCTVYWFMNFRQCFFWYLLEIIGFILYIIPGFIFWCFKDYGGQEIENKLWKGINDFDCWVYDMTNFHIIHYSEDIIKKCYSCTPGPFPTLNFSFKGKANINDITKKQLNPVG
tara:strand:- start:7195 stop:8124 length:930 start_codon:yes stop_codon:yes gene_type:complete